MTVVDFRAFNRKKGRAGEEIAVRFLKQQGIYIKQTNFYTRSGELDIIGFDNKTLVFFEVKFRNSTRRGLPAEAVNHTKRLRIINAARFYMHRFGFSPDFPVRFDVISILGSEIRWIKSAFDCSGLNI